MWFGRSFGLESATALRRRSRRRRRAHGRDLAGLDQNQIGDLLQGATGTDVTVDIQRPGTREILTFELPRQKVKVPDVPYQGMLSETTGYLALNSFTKTASFEVRKALMNLTDSLGAEQVVIDLRGNGGGLLREAIAMVNLFVGKGQEVVSTKGKTPDWNKSYKTRANALRPDLPIAILVDGKSASASEIVAGTLQDLDRGVVVGSESFGKGLVQQTKKLAYGTRMKVTVAKYYTPSGRCVQRLDYSHRDDEGEVHAMADSTLSTFYTANGREVLEGRGVLPDVEVPQPDLSYVLEGLLENGVLFDFAVQHRDALVAPEDAIAFEVSDGTWRLFVDFAQGLTDLPYASKPSKPSKPSNARRKKNCSMRPMLLPSRRCAPDSWRTWARIWNATARRLSASWRTSSWFTSTTPRASTATAWPTIPWRNGP